MIINKSANILIRKQKRCTRFLSSCRNSSQWKCGRTRNAVETRAAGECFHSFFEFSQTFPSVFITKQKHRECVFYFYQETPQQKQGKQLVYFDHQNVNNYLCSHHHYVHSSCYFCVSIELQKHNLTNQCMYFLRAVFNNFFL